MTGLTNIPALDVAIGLAFLYFVLSTAISMINEAIANVLGWRAKTLEDAVRSLLGEPKVRRELASGSGASSITIPVTSQAPCFTTGACRAWCATRAPSAGAAGGLPICPVRSSRSR